MTIKFYGYDKCSTCRKAQAFLKAKGQLFDAIDITKTPPSRDELNSLLTNLGGELRRLFNTSGLVYREMKLSEKIGSFSADEALKLLASNGRLVKRPVLVVNGKAVAAGFSEKEWSKFI
jgi:Spx/MgsR family transcriptional regulator